MEEHYIAKYKIRMEEHYIAKYKSQLYVKDCLFPSMQHAQVVVFSMAMCRAAAYCLAKSTVDSFFACAGQEDAEGAVIRGAVEECRRKLCTRM